jgi:dCTP deaminase
MAFALSVTVRWFGGSAPGSWTTGFSAPWTVTVNGTEHPWCNATKCGPRGAPTVNSFLSMLVGERGQAASGGDARPTTEVAAPSATGVLPIQAIRNLVREGSVTSVDEISADQFQPASLDLRLGNVAYRVRASFLPGPQATVTEKIEALDGYEIDLTRPEGAVLERGCVYVIPLQESLALKGQISGLANPKSSAGRLDILTRLIADKSAAFDQIEQNYEGPLFVELAPRTFSIVVHRGSRLNQLRFLRGSGKGFDSEMGRLFREGKLISPRAEESQLRDGMVGVSIDLRGSGEKALIGYRAKKHTDRIDVEKLGWYPARDFWEAIYNHGNQPIILDPNDFYILATREFVSIPPDYAAEMVAYDTTVGEFRVHYAGFFDPGFGYGPDGPQSKAVLEVRSHEVPFMLEHGQIIGWLRYDRMAGKPERLYGSQMGSNYQNQGLALAKQFRP